MVDRFDSYCAICGFILSLEFSFSTSDTFVPASGEPERNILFRNADADDVDEEEDEDEEEEEKEKKEVPKARASMQLPMSGGGTGVPAFDNYDWEGNTDGHGDVEEYTTNYANYLVYDEYDEEVKSDGIEEIVENEKAAYVGDPADIPLSSYFGYDEFIERQAARNTEAADMGEYRENEEDGDHEDHEDYGDHEEYEEYVGTEDGHPDTTGAELNCRCISCSRWRMAMRQQQQYAAETNGPPAPLDPFTREPDERIDLLAQPPLAGPEAAWARELRVIGD
ncbi:hypothetical protein N3K66_008670 [Trichothecium roseum]|uniref:Uncharacterized protein n=1 Tax=Trichothecium roseum TaxID=47278 RepID=A0ACC0UR81_9HYPO|nr:hypothetical protein N3K66_008670 [Trichothecium roseum]